MKISTEIASMSKVIGYEKAVEYVAKAGFDAYDFSMLDMLYYDQINKIASPGPAPMGGGNCIDFIRKIKRIADDNGIVCNQSHAPAPLFCPGMIDMCKMAIEYTAEAGGEICVIHPDNYKCAEENAEMYFELLPIAKEYGVKIAAENVWNWNFEEQYVLPGACSCPEDFLKHLHAVNDDYLVACVDIGHAEIKRLNTSAVEMIKALGHHVQALHIHDVDGVNDNHQIPGALNVDFPPILKALKEIDYKGYFTLEAKAHCSKYVCDESTIFDRIKDLKNAAEKLATMFENM